MLNFLDRIGRPLLRLCCIVWIMSIGASLTYAYWRAALGGLPVPDMSGGLTNIALGLVPLAIDQFTRSRERVREIDRGVIRGPFAPSQPSPESWPRPGDSP